MARDWHELFITADGAPAAPTGAETEERRRGFFRRLRSNMRKTREALQAEVSATLFETLDDETWERLEEALIYADVGARTTAQVVERLEGEASAGDITGGEALSNRLAELLAELARTGSDTIDLRPHPTVILMVGVNGTGKTTTIGKLAWHLRKELGQSVVLGAADTFRAAAVEQLQIWGERTGSRVHVPAKEGADAAGLAFDALKAAREDGTQVLLVDTAGRLHNKSALMEELRKIIRVIRRVDETAPHSVLLVLDATTGQNAIQQCKVFGEMVNVTGLAVTKLDGSAKGGVVVALAQEFGMPVHFVGVGEKAADLRPFEARDFARGLMGLD
jgi:fused signal recognition particle receptor